MKLDRIFDAMIEQRLKMDGDGGKESKDFLQVLLKLRDEEDAKTPLTMNHLKALLLDMVVGGTDTSSNTIELAMAELMNKPEMMEKAQQEIDSIVGNDNTVEESHLQKLHYLNAIMKEVFRLHPALPLLVPHSPSESCIIGGYTIPKGARVFVNVWAIQPFGKIRWSFVLRDLWMENWSIVEMTSIISHLGLAEEFVQE